MPSYLRIDFLCILMNQKLIFFEDEIASLIHIKSIEKETIRVRSLPECARYRGMVAMIAIIRTFALSIIAVAIVAGPTNVQADEASAKRILRSMSDYVTSQRTLSLTFDADIEVITKELQKIQFASSGQVLLSRPDKLHATRTGGYANVELVFDGKVLNIIGKDENVFAQLDAAGSVDQLIDRLRDTFSIGMPGADLLLSRLYDELIENVVDAKHIGRGVIDGIECEHLAFRTPDTDWQLWVELGARPIPRKYVITSKEITGAPQYTLRIKDWRTDVAVAPDAFAFKPPEGAKKVEAAGLANLDEIPPGIATGGRR